VIGGFMESGHPRDFGRDEVWFADRCQGDKPATIGRTTTFVGDVDRQSGFANPTGAGQVE
jgi:hypothetical protein